MPAQPLDLTALRVLVSVSENGSMSATARRLGMAQPNVSRALSRLERSLGFRLLDRGPRGSRLTANGAVIADWAREVVESADRLTLGAAALRAEHRSHLRVAASMSIAEALMPAWLARLRHAHDRLDIRLNVHNSKTILDLVEEGACDVGFIETPVCRGGLRFADVAHDRLVVVVPPGHPWSRRRRPVTAAELAGTSLVVREPGSGTRDTLDTALSEHTLVPPALELVGNAAVRVGCASGAGPAVLSELAVASSVRGGELVPVPTIGIDLERRLRAVWPGNGPGHGVAGDLIAIARQQDLGQRVPPGTGRPPPTQSRGRP